MVAKRVDELDKERRGVKVKIWSRNKSVELVLVGKEKWRRVAREEMRVRMRE